MSFQGPTYQKLNGNLGGQNPSGDKVLGLVAGGVVTAQYTTLGTIVELLQLSDAEDLGFTSSYDSTNEVLVHYHISEFFQDNPNGTLLLMVVAKGTTQAAMWDKAESYVWKLLTDASQRGRVRVAGTVLNPAAAYAPTTTNGIDTDVEAAITKAQALVEALASEEGILLDACIIEGRNADNSPANLPDLRALTARNVSVVIAADPQVVALNEEYEGTAAVGTVLKGLSVRQISENLGSVNILNKPPLKAGDLSFPLDNPALSRWESAALSGGVNVASLSIADKTLLTTKGYIYIGAFQNFAGQYFNDAPTCIALSDDYERIEKNRVWNKAVRLLDGALIPMIRGKFKRDVETGFPSSSTIAYWTTQAKEKLQQLVDQNDASGVDVYIAPQKVDASNPLTVKVSIVIDGILYSIDVQVGLTNSIN